MAFLKAKVSEESATGNASSNYGGHSLRTEFITQTALNDVPVHLIMSQTGHKKVETVNDYIRIANRWKENAAIRLGL